MIEPRVLFLCCPEFEDVPSSVKGLDDEESFGLLYCAVKCISGELCEDRALRTFGGVISCKDGVTRAFGELSAFSFFLSNC